MMRFSSCLLAILVFTGCHAPMPSFNLLAPYGPTRIPPPATGSVGPDQYYQPSGQSSTAPVGTGFRARQASTSLSADANSKASAARTASGTREEGQVARASHETTMVVPTRLTPAKTVDQPPRSIRIPESTTSRSLPPNVRGMRVNEVRAEPARFFPSVQAVDIMQLPPASSASYAHVVPRNEALGTSTTQRSSVSQASSRGSIGGSGWQPRD